VMRFEFATAPRILFGAGALREVGAIARTMGRRALVVTGRDPGRAGSLLAILKEHEAPNIVFALAGEPTIPTVCAGVQRARDEHCDWVIGFGGGSAVDAGKAIAAL